MDSATGQKAFVLAFAAVAVAGAAYFATVMIAPDDDPTTVISRANARPQVEAQVEAIRPAAPTSPAKLAASAVETAPAAESEAIAATPEATPASEPVIEAAAAFPAPVRVKTVSVPTPATAAPQPAPAPSQAVGAPAAADATTQVATADPTPTIPVAASAFATDDPLVSAGIEAVMGVATKERAADNAPVASKKKNDDTQVASSDEPEMAGSEGTRRIRTGVNMRAAPRSGAQIIGTIPTNAAVSVAPGCKQWCSVSYNGKRGFIYKSFLR